MHSNCPVCMDFLFDSREAATVLDCGHTLHNKCRAQLLQSNSFGCPICSVAMIDMSREWDITAGNADPAAVLAYLKEKFRKERARPTFLFCLKHAQSNYYDRTGDPCGATRRIIMEFAGLFPA